MFSRRGFWFFRLGLGVIVFACVLNIASVFADSNVSSLSVKPNRCIALHQGQTCYMSLSFQWKTPATGEYCLFDDRKSNPLICWIGDRRLSFKHEFVADSNVVYDIRARNERKSLSQALVKISWVYKSNTESNSRWRLF